MPSSLRAAAALALLAGGPLHAAEVLDRIPAVVDGRPVFLSDVRLRMRLHGVTEAVALEAAIDEELMYAEAARLPRAAPTPAETEAALSSLRARPGAGGAPPEALARVARRQAAILKYLAFRFRQTEGGGPEEERIEAWVKELRAAADVRYNGGPGSP